MLISKLLCKQDMVVVLVTLSKWSCNATQNGEISPDSPEVALWETAPERILSFPQGCISGVAAASSNRSAIRYSECYASGL